MARHITKKLLIVFDDKDAILNMSI